MSISSRAEQSGEVDYTRVQMLKYEPNRFQSNSHHFFILNPFEVDGFVLSMLTKHVQAIFHPICIKKMYVLRLFCILLLLSTFLWKLVSAMG